MLAALLATLIADGPLVGDALAAYEAVVAFLATPAGKDLETQLGKLFAHEAQPSGDTETVQVVVTANYPGAHGRSMY